MDRVSHSAFPLPPHCLFDDLGFEWGVSSTELVYHERTFHMKDFNKTHGHLCVKEVWKNLASFYRV